MNAQIKNMPVLSSCLTTNGYADTRSTVALACGFLIAVNTGFVLIYFSKGVKSRLKSYPFVKHDFLWTRVSAQLFVVKQLDNTGILFIYAFIITGYYLIEVERWYLNNFEPAWGGFNYPHAGQTNILCNYSTAWLLLYYRLDIWTYQVYMHQITRFQVSKHSQLEDFHKESFCF